MVFIKSIEKIDLPSNRLIEKHSTAITRDSRDIFVWFF